MRARIVWTAVGAWFLIAVLAVANGTLREALLIPAFGNAWAQIISIAILAAIVLALEWWLVTRPWATLTTGHLLAIGACWTAATILFEFALGRLVLDMSWSDLLQQYNIFAGRLWPIVPLLMLFGMPGIRMLARRH